ncbi:hypothetical protein Tco_1171207 [Tanacetum coccineum]
MVPKAVLMRSGLVSLTTARPVNTSQPKTTVNNARPMKNVFNKAHLTVRRPINNKTKTKNSNFNQRVNTVSGKNVNAARPKAVVNTARPKAVLNAVKENQNEGFFDGYSINSKAFRVLNSKNYIVLKRTLHVSLGTKLSEMQFKEFSYAGSKPSGDDEKKVTEEPGKEGGDSSKYSECSDQEKDDNVNSTNNVNTAINVVGTKTSIELLDDPNMHALEDIIYSDEDEDVGAEVDMNNLIFSMPVKSLF